MIWGCSSVGRTPPLHGGSRRFESCQLHYHPTFVVNARAVLQANSRPPRWVAHNYVVVPEWLRGWIANPLFVGSIPTHHSKKMQNIFVFQDLYKYILLRWKSYRKDVLIPSKRCRFDSYPPLNFWPSWAI